MDHPPLRPTNNGSFPLTLGSFLFLTLHFSVICRILLKDNRQYSHVNKHSRSNSYNKLWEKMHKIHFILLKWGRDRKKRGPLCRDFPIFPTLLLCLNLFQNHWKLNSISVTFYWCVVFLIINFQLTKELVQTYAEGSN